MIIDLSSYRGLINSLQVVLIAVSDLIFLSEGENNRDLFQRREDYGDIEGMKKTYQWINSEINKTKEWKLKESV